MGATFWYVSIRRDGQSRRVRFPHTPPFSGRLPLRPESMHSEPVSSAGSFRHAFFSLLTLLVSLIGGSSCVTSSPAPQWVEKEVAVFTEDQSSEFLRAIRTRTALTEEAVAIERHLARKMRELSQRDAALREQYGMEAGRVWLYRPETRTLVWVGESEAGEREEHEFRTLPDEAASERFIALLNAKQAAADQIAAFRDARAEKLNKIARINKWLLRTHGVRPDAQYRYDEATRTLWEKVPVPQDSPAVEESEDGEGEGSGEEAEPQPEPAS